MNVLIYHNPKYGGKSYTWNYDLVTLHELTLECRYVLQWMFNNDHKFHINHETVSKTLGITERKVKSIFDELKKHGYLFHEHYTMKGVYGSVSWYHICDTGNITQIMQPKKPIKVEPEPVAEAAPTPAPTTQLPEATPLQVDAAERLRLFGLLERTLLADCRPREKDQQRVVAVTKYTENGVKMDDDAFLQFSCKVLRLDPKLLSPLSA
jgi:hypothetical protein